MRRAPSQHARHVLDALVAPLNCPAGIRGVDDPERVLQQLHDRLSSLANACHDPDGAATRDGAVMRWASAS